MKVNELVWKKMSLCESESESSFVDQVGQTSSGECKANNLNSASSRYFECTVFTILHHCIELVRVSGLATSAGTTSSCTRRWRSSSSTPTPTTTYHKNTSKVRCSKNAEGREPDFQQPGDNVYFQARSMFLASTKRFHCCKLKENFWRTKYQDFPGAFIHCQLLVDFWSNCRTASFPWTRRMNTFDALLSIGS